jgi:hypothetical protein
LGEDACDSGGQTKSAGAGPSSAVASGALDSCMGACITIDIKFKKPTSKNMFPHKKHVPISCFSDSVILIFLLVMYSVVFMPVQSNNINLPLQKIVLSVLFAALLLTGA